MNEVIIIYAVTLLLAWPLGMYIAGVFNGGTGAGGTVFLPVENGLYRLFGVDPTQPMSWQGYGKALLKLHLVLVLIVFGLLMAQGVLFINPDGIDGMSWDLALHTAVSFLTNTNQQHYSGQAQLSYLAHTFGVVTLQVVTPAAGMAALVAIVRTLLGRPDKKPQPSPDGTVSVGNFYEDVTRAIVRVMLPIATVIALMLASQGVPNTYEGARTAIPLDQTIEMAEQHIPIGPVAPMVAIKQVGTNGGGWYGPNSSVPLENPTPLSNFVQTVSIVLIPAALVFALGFLTGRRRLALVVMGVMVVMSVSLTSVTIWSENQPNAAFAGLAAEGPNLEGKEVRFGATATALWGSWTTQTSNGSVNGMHDSFNPIGGMITMIDMFINATFGGIGVGLIGYLLFLLLAAFLGSLMIGRAPEIAGKALETREMKLVCIALLIQPLLILRQSLLRLSPKHLARNPVMMLVGVGTLITGLLGITHLVQGELAAPDFAICGILLFTVLFANGAESVAEARGKAQAGALRATRKDLKARKLDDDQQKEVPATDLRRGDQVLVKPNELIPADGEIVTGAATINESAVTGESAPVLREAGTDNSGVSAGTKVLSDDIEIEVTVDPGNSLLDRMIALVEGAKRQKTPSELALSVLLAAMTLVFLIVVVTLVPFAGFVGAYPSFSVLVALLVCLIPTTIGGLLPAIGIAGMDRAMRANVIAKSGKAVEVAGSIDTLLLDKTGTITLGDRRATAFEPVQGVAPGTLRDAALLTSLADPTPEGKSIVALARDNGSKIEAIEGTEFIEFSASTRMSGVDLPDGRILRKGATNAVRKLVTENGGHYPQETDRLVERVAKNGATPLVVAEGNRVLGVIALSDVIKSGIKERFSKLREMGVKTVMITGDNPITAAAIAAEAGVDDFVAEATPEQKLEIIRKEQAGGRLVAMVGDGTNDAPALAQADLGLAMNSGTQAAREAGNMVDLDSDPGKLLEVVEIGKQLLITRGSLTTFSLANDVAKYFAILPALFVGSLPALDVLNILNLSNPMNAVLAATIFNALIIPALIPFALKGVRFKPASATHLLRRNLLIFGVGGLLLPFPAIKVLDLMLTVVL